ncbi:hypothetical protein P3875_01965 [Myroides sp. JBRI-B21084]|uniref:hypothetical protein n=1 Tax=Myroides sp. JBRI-B21084 TaxID=3119977 RepID=UPI0026E34E74|nr:hypothetical protein [Paenimyroides cloacae]WKW46859.1 hypothetical protein P3875_01965 [Paenimyroides cloacae]
MQNIALKNKTINNQKYRNLLLGLLFDAIGTLSFSIPFLGEFTDVIWAPISVILIKTMYKDKVGTIAGTISFIEEILPGVDFIPTFTLTWFYTYFIRKN